MPGRTDDVGRTLASTLTSGWQFKVGPKATAGRQGHQTLECKVRGHRDGEPGHCGCHARPFMWDFVARPPSFLPSLPPSFLPSSLFPFTRSKVVNFPWLLMAQCTAILPWKFDRPPGSSLSGGSIVEGSADSALVFCPTQRWLCCVDIDLDVLLSSRVPLFVAPYLVDGGAPKSCSRLNPDPGLLSQR